MHYNILVVVAQACTFEKVHGLTVDHCIVNVSQHQDRPLTFEKLTVALSHGKTSKGQRALTCVDNLPLQPQSQQAPPLLFLSVVHQLRHGGLVKHTIFVVAILIAREVLVDFEVAQVGYGNGHDLTCANGRGYICITSCDVCDMCLAY